MHDDFKILYCATQRPTLDEFYQVCSSLENAPRFHIGSEGLLSYEGRGHFGLLVYRKPMLNFVLLVTMRTPIVGHRANSGVYLRIADPSTPLDQYPKRQQEKIRSNLRAWTNGDISQAPGIPAIHSGYELQLEMGFEEEATQRRNGAFYDVPLGPNAGEQLASPLILHEHDSDVHLRITVQGPHYQCEMTRADSSFVRTAMFVNADPTRGAQAGFVALQAYHADFQDLHPFRFSRIAIKQLSE